MVERLRGFHLLALGDVAGDAEDLHHLALGRHVRNDLEFAGHNRPVAAVVLVLAAEARWLIAVGDGGEQPLVVGFVACRRCRWVYLLEGLRHRLGGADAPDPLDGGADVGDGAVQAHGPDDVPGVLGEQSVALLGAAKIDLHLRELGDVLQSALDDRRGVLAAAGLHPAAGVDRLPIGRPPGQLDRGALPRLESQERIERIG